MPWPLKHQTVLSLASLPPTTPQYSKASWPRGDGDAMRIEDAIKVLKAAGYRVSKPKPVNKSRVGPTFVAYFADGQVTRMSTFTSLTNLDRERGIRLSQAAYESRNKRLPPPIVASHFEHDGITLQRY
jgi:hypothetical protein